MASSPKNDLEEVEKAIDAIALKINKEENENPHVDADSEKCKVCEEAKSNCQCSKKKPDNPDVDEKSSSDNNSAQASDNPVQENQSSDQQSTLVKFSVTDGGRKIAQTTAEKGDVYGLLENITLENILEKFESHLGLLAEAQETTVADLKLQGYNAERDKIQGLLTLIFPNQEKKDIFLDSLIKTNMINSTPMNSAQETGETGTGMLDPFATPVPKLIPIPHGTS